MGSRPAIPKREPDTYAKRREMYDRLTPQQKSDFRNEINAMADSLKREREKNKPPAPTPPPVEQGIPTRRSRRRRITNVGVVTGFRRNDSPV